MTELSRIVIDTNVLVAALRSRKGWSFPLLSLVGRQRFQHLLTVPLLMEYEDVLLRPGMVPLGVDAVNDVLDYLCATAVRQSVHFLWRPQLTDVKDDMVLEAAVNGACRYIVTWNVRDFPTASTSRWGVQAVTPDVFLNQKGTEP